jgi:putative SOS response-associated peptidase YedK
MARCLNTQNSGCLLQVVARQVEIRTAHGKHKQPFLIGVGQGDLFAFAGLWEDWERNGEIIQSCTILTTEANDRMRSIHDRMPVILSPADYPRWLNGAVKPAEVMPLLRPFPAEAMDSWPVSTHVSNPRNDDPLCVQPAA